MKRYNVDSITDCLYEADDGEWVRYADVAAHLARVKRMEEALRRVPDLKVALRGVDAAWNDGDVRAQEVAQAQVDAIEAQIAAALADSPGKGDGNAGRL